MTLLYGTTVTLRPVTQEDVGRLTGILLQPEVAEWWPRYDEARVRRELIDSAGVVAFVIEVEGELIGSTLYHEEPSRDYRHATIDLFLDRAWHGKGLGTDTVRTLARHLFFDRGHHRLATDPAASNEKAVRTFQHVGFRSVGLMRRCARDAHGEWRDGLLMDLLKQDLQ